MSWRCRKRRRACGAGGTLALAAALLPVPALAAPLAEEELWLEVRLGPEVLAEQLVAYRRGEALLLPLGQLCRKLGLAVEVAPADGRAEGFVLSEDRTFSIDAAAGRVRLQGVESAFAPDRIKRSEDELYVDAALLRQWMPLDLEADLFSLRLRVAPREPLPMQERLERLRRYQRLMAQQPAEGLPRVEDRYALLTAPAIDQSLTLGLRQLPTGGRAYEGSYATYATGDLMYMSSALYAMGDQRRPLSELRLSMGRRDPAPRLLGPFAAREFAFGNVQAPGMPLVARPRPGNGLLVSSYPLDQQSQFDSHNFRGPLPRGWDVELYRNGALEGYQAARPDGLYTFDAVPLRAGLNEFRLVFYGPQGQRHEEVRRFNVGASLAPEGEQRYRTAMLLHEDGRPRVQLQHDYGLTRHLTAGWGLASLPGGTDRQTFGLAGLRGYWGPLFAHADGALSPVGTGGGELGVQALLGPFDLGLRHARLSGFASEVFEDAAAPLRSRTQAQLRADVLPRPYWRMTAGLEARRDETEGGAIIDRLVFPTSLRYRRLALSHQLAWDLAPSRLADGSFLEGQLQAAFRLPPMSLRAQVHYATTGLTGVSVGANGALVWDHHLQATVGYVPLLDDWRYELTLSRNMGPLMLSTTAQHLDGGGATLATTASTGASHDPLQARWHPHGEPVAEAGAASVQVFLDENMNGERDEEEQVLSGVRVVAAGRPVARTGPDGVAHVSGLTSHQEAQLTVVAESLEDPLWQPRIRGLSFVPRPGKTVKLMLPVMATAEVTGTVRLARDGAPAPIAGAELELVDAAGKVTHRARSAYDGFFALLAVPPGSYRLRLAPAQAEKLGPCAAVPVTVEAGGGFLDDRDLLITPEAAASPVLQ